MQDNKLQAGFLQQKESGISRYIGSAGVVVAVGLVCAFGFILFYNLRVLFDEGFNLQIPIQLLLNGKYQTSYDGFKPFNPVISTGPTVLIPITIVFKLVGVGIYQARTINLLYFWSVVILVVSLILLDGQPRRSRKTTG